MLLIIMFHPYEGAQKYKIGIYKLQIRRYLNLYEPKALDV